MKKTNLSKEKQKKIDQLDTDGQIKYYKEKGKRNFAVGFIIAILGFIPASIIGAVFTLKSDKVKLKAIEHIPQQAYYETACAEELDKIDERYAKGELTAQEVSKEIDKLSQFEFKNKVANENNDEEYLALMAQSDKYLKSGFQGLFFTYIPFLVAGMGVSFSGNMLKIKSENLQEQKDVEEAKREGEELLREFN